MKKFSISKRIMALALSLIMVLGMMPIAPLTVEAATTTAKLPSFISQIAVAHGDSASEAKSRLSGYTIIDFDLNKGCGSGSDYIYIGYKTTTDYEQAIYDIRFANMANQFTPDQSVGGSFTLLGSTAEPNGSGQGVVDLNVGAGGNYIYMYISRNRGYHVSPLTEIVINETSSLSGYQTATGLANSSPAVDLNDGCGKDSAYVYLHQKKFSGAATTTIHYLDKNGESQTIVPWVNSTDPSVTVLVYPSTFNIPEVIEYHGSTLYLELFSVNGSLISSKQFNIYFNQLRELHARYFRELTLSFDANGGTDAPNSVTSKFSLEYDENGDAKITSHSFRIPTEMPSHATKRFIGWSENKDATTATYLPGSSIEINKGTTLYAIYEGHEDEWVYTVTGNTITAECTADGCENPNGGSVTLNATDGYYTGSPIGARVGGGFTNGATYKVTYNGSETVPSDAATYTAKLTVYENGTEKQNVTADYTISYLSAPTPAYIVGGYAHKAENTYWYKSGSVVTVTAPAGYRISTALNGIYGELLSFLESDNKVIYLKDENGAMTDAIEVEGVYFDTTAPIGTLTVTDRNFWQQLLSKITFGLFFKSDKVATVDSADTESGVKSVEYYLADNDLIADESLDNAAAVAKLEMAVSAAWNNYENNIQLNNNAKNVIYVKITDNVGNVTYLSSDGIVIDSIAPNFYGIEDGGEYYGDKIFKATDDHFLRIELDGVDITDTTEGDDEFEIKADNARHTVTVTDLAGNVTEYKITVYKNYTVTYTVDGQTVFTETVGHGKNANLPAVSPRDGFVGKWDSDGKNITGDTTINAVYTKIPVVKPDAVKPEDKTELEDAKTKLEEEQNDGSYTEDDQKKIQDAIDDIDDALAVITNVEAVEELIDKLPDAIKKDDEPAIKAADDAYNALTDYEKSLVDENVKKALDDAKAALNALNKPVTDPDGPQTGDNSNIALWIVLLFISGGTVFTLTAYDRKRRRTAKH